MADGGNIKDKLNVTNLGADKQKSLFDDFQKAGGKVVNVGNELDEKERAARRLREAVDKSRQQLPQDDLPVNNPVEVRGEIPAAKMAEETLVHNKASFSELNPRKQNSTSYLSEFIGARFTAWMKGVSRLMSGSPNPAFIMFIISELKSGLTTIRSIVTSAMHQNHQLSRVIRETLLQGDRNSLDFELFYRLDEIYDENEFKLISKLFDANAVGNSYKDSLIFLYRKINLLYTHKGMLKKAAGIVLQAESSIRSLEKGVAEKNIAVMNKIIDFIFGKFYPSLSLLIDCYFKQESYELFRDTGKALTMKDFLHFEPRDIIGTYTQQWLEEDREDDRRKRDEEKSKEKKETQGEHNENTHIEEGLKLIAQTVHFREILEGLKSLKEARSHFELRERAFIFYTLLEFFNNEFSYLFLSGKVQFEICRDKFGNLLDLKAIFKTVYDLLKPAYEEINEYIKILGYQKHLATTVPAAAMEANPENKRLQEQKADLLKKINGNTRKFLEEMTKMIQSLIHDSSKFTKFVKNGSEIISGDNRYSGMKLILHQNYFQAFVYAYYFCYAFLYLVRQGELSAFDLFVEKPTNLNL